MRRLLLVLASLAATGAVAAGVALAVSALDRDDVASALDVAKVGGAHNRATDELVHVVDFFEPVDPAKLVRSKRPPSSVCVEIWTRSRPGESAPDYEACASAAGRPGRWKASLARKRARGPQLRLGRIEVEQPSETRLVLRVDPDDVKRPESYRWRVEVTSFGRECRASRGCPDYAPDRPGTAETRLRAPRS